MYLDRFKLTDRVALVTGGASGIGYSTVQALAEAGARVTIADLKLADIDAARRSLSELGYEVEGAAMDVTDSARVAGGGRRAGGAARPVDILVNNAGIARSEIAAEALTTSTG